MNSAPGTYETELVKICGRKKEEIPEKLTEGSPDVIKPVSDGGRTSEENAKIFRRNSS